MSADGQERLGQGGAGGAGRPARRVPKFRRRRRRGRTRCSTRRSTCSSKRASPPPGSRTSRRRAGLVKGAVYLYFPSQGSVSSRRWCGAPCVPIAESAVATLEHPHRATRATPFLMLFRLMRSDSAEPRVLAIPKLIVREVTGPSRARRRCIGARCIDRALPVVSSGRAAASRTAVFRPVDPELAVRSLRRPDRHAPDDGRDLRHGARGRARARAGSSRPIIDILFNGLSGQTGPRDAMNGLFAWLAGLLPRSFPAWGSAAAGFTGYVDADYVYVAAADRRDHRELPGAGRADGESGRGAVQPDRCAAAGAAAARRRAGRTPRRPPGKI